MVPIVNDRIKAAFMQLRELGLEVVEYNSLSLSGLFFIPKLLDRDHRKYWVVDGELLAVGGVNVNHTSIDWPEGIGNIDTMAEIVSAGATRAVIDTFVDTWNNYSTKPLASEDFTVPQTTAHQEGETTELWLLDHYWPSRPQVTTLFDLFSTYTQEQLWMIQGYTFLTPALLDRIRYVTDRGVKVNIMLSDYSTQPKYEMASRYGLLDLIDAGANVYMYHSPDGAFLHAKIMVADGTLVTIGSANYNFRSQTLSRELNLVFEDARVGSYTLEYIASLLDECRVVTREEAESYRDFRSWYNYILMQVWG
jgi:cardiolipin synthase